MPKVRCDRVLSTGLFSRCSCLFTKLKAPYTICLKGFKNMTSSPTPFPRARGWYKDQWHSVFLVINSHSDTVWEPHPESPHWSRLQSFLKGFIMKNQRYTNCPGKSKGLKDLCARSRRPNHTCIYLSLRSNTAVVFASNLMYPLELLGFCFVPVSEPLASCWLLVTGSSLHQYPPKEIL